MISNQVIEGRLRKLKPTLSKRFHVDKLGYFGSFVNNSNHSQSDLDILVFLEEPLGWSFFDLKELLEQELNTPIDLVSYDALRTELGDEIVNSTKFID